MKTAFLVAGLGLALTCISQSATAQTAAAHAFERAFGPCSGQTCVVRSSPGGEVRRFLAAAAAVRAGAKQLVIIDGPCHSACAIFADVARERVCITPRASFGFHKATLYRAEGRGSERTLTRIARSDPRHSADIARWVHANGGFPTRGMNVMNNRQAQKFWRSCRIVQR